MKNARFFIKALFYITAIFCTFCFSAVIYFSNSLSKDYKIKNGDLLNIDTALPVTAVHNGAQLSQRNLNTVGSNYEVDLKLFGLIPISTAKVEIVDELQVAVLGHPFGMKLYTEGVLVVDITEVKTESGLKNPAEEAGLKIGDYIISVNDKKVYTNEDLSDIVEDSDGKNMKFLILRKNKKISLKFSAEMSEETGNYKIGIWVKDSSAGIGTLTFFSPATNIVCGLGHGICDGETGVLLKHNTGEIVSAEIIGVEKGCIGSPGQLNGKLNYDSLGSITLNSEAGVYSKLTGKLDLSKMVEVAVKQEVKNGKGKILCTIDGETPKFYDCEISVRTSAFLSKTQNMIVTITDSELLDATGGIVQGMSGSPLLQNGKLIGAVTHVLVDDPTKGYAIFAENMLETAQSVAQEQLKDAS